MCGGTNAGAGAPAPSRASNRRAWRAALAGYALVAIACSGQAVPETLVLGATVPLSGTDAPIGEAMRRGYERAVNEVNRAGGVAIGAAQKLRVRFDVRDDASEASRAERLATELLSGDCHALLGTASPVRVVVQAAVAENIRKPLLVAAADGVPGARARWTFAVPSSGDPEQRAYETARAALRAFEAARGGDPNALRYALLR
jgi:ABC-type branched-subunit amino acid transport system substrate-binding protein